MFTNTVARSCKLALPTREAMTDGIGDASPSAASAVAATTVAGWTNTRLTVDGGRVARLEVRLGPVGRLQMCRQTGRCAPLAATQSEQSAQRPYVVARRYCPLFRAGFLFVLVSVAAVWE